MQRRARLWNVRLQVAILFSILMGALFWIISAKEVTPGYEIFRRELAQMKSQTAVAQLLAEQILTKSITSTYLNAQVWGMRKNIQSGLKNLDTLSANPGLQWKIDQAKELATQLNASLQILSDSFENEEKASALKDVSAHLFAQLVELESKLKPF